MSETPISTLVMSSFDHSTSEVEHALRNLHDAGLTIQSSESAAKVTLVVSGRYRSKADSILGRTAFATIHRLCLRGVTAASAKHF